MLRRLLLPLVAIGLGASSLSIDQNASATATWRWSVNTILDAQRASASAQNAVPMKPFGLHDRRYAPTGTTEFPADTSEH